MIWPQLKVLLPSFIGYWLLVMLVASLAWYGWTRVYTNFVFKWRAPLILATAATVYMIGNTTMLMYQNMVMSAFEGQHGTRTTVADGGGETAPKNSTLELKSKFLNAVGSLLGNPEQITPDLKKKLFADFGKLFPTDTDKAEYAKQVALVYSCQRAFWEDALTSYKAKVVIKSDERTQCESLSGAFYNREFLVPPDTAKSNNEMIKGLSAHKRIPASDGKMVEVNEDMLRTALEAQLKAISSIKKLFD